MGPNNSFDRLWPQSANEDSAAPTDTSNAKREGHVRISAFNSRENVRTALARIAAALK